MSHLKSLLFTILILLVTSTSLTLLTSCSSPTPSEQAPDSERSVEKSKKAEPLPKLGADENLITVSGVSAGAHMATQLQIAYSKIFQGVGSIAGGPWKCAMGTVWLATGRCMERTNDIDVPFLLRELQSAARSGDVDPLSNLKSKRVYLFNSPTDAVVRPPVGEKTREFFTALIPAAQVKTEFSLSTNHTYPTLNYGLRCGEVGSPYLSNCGFDTAGELLRTLYPNQNLKRATPVASSLRVFDQTEFDNGFAYLAREGWAYIPEACSKADVKCPVHVALHGCSQGSDAIKDVFALYAGYNDWAEGSQIIVIYPQTYASAARNPKGCFDWFGYTGVNYAYKSGPQMKAIKAMVDRLKASKN